MIMKRTEQSNARRERDVLIPTVIAVSGIVVGVILVIASSVMLMQSGGGDDPVVTTTTTTTATTTVASSTVLSTTATTTSTTEAPTTTTVEITTTTEEPTTTTEATTTTTAPPMNYDDGEWNMLLVNPWNGLTREQLDDESRLVYAENGEYVDERIYDQLMALIDAASDYGLYVTSGYRSYDTQEYLYNNKVDRVMAEGYSYEESLDIAATVVARPGTSEHHTGLAVDFLHNECWELEEYWEDSEAFDWMMEHCADYGFILRYPKESQHITGVIYEPWHYRYVGVEAAQAIMSQGITLEEYLGAY